MSDQRPILALAMTGSPAEPWINALRDRLPGFAVTVLTEDLPAERVHYVAAWKHPRGLLARLTGLKAIFSLGAGVDHLLDDPDLPAGIPVARVVDPDLTARMSEWVLLHVLMHHRQQRLYDYQQFERIWADDLGQPAARDVRVGVMGLGVLGQDAVRKLATLGFDVAGWSRTAKALDGIDTFAGPDGLPAFLARTEILVCLLPLTPDTKGILDMALFEGLARDSHFGGPILLNAGRGGLQNEADIVRALDEGVLRAATLDVFATEPLPETSPLWHHPAVTITPHNAAISNPDAIAAYIAGQIKAVEGGATLLNRVDRDAMY